jgi:hypothetical protein
VKPVLVQTAEAVLTIDAEEGVVDIEAGAGLARPPEIAVSLPGVIAAVGAGSTVVALLPRRPPLAISHDAGRTWHESGGGLPRGQAIAIDQDDPDSILFAAQHRVWASHDGGRFWESVAIDLPEIVAVGFREA